MIAAFYVLTKHERRPFLLTPSDSFFHPGESGTSALYGMTPLCSNGGKRAVWTPIPWGVLLLALTLLAGCATPKPTATSAPKPGAGLEEYRQLACQSATAVLDSLSLLEQVNAQATSCPPKLLATFSAQVHKLEVGSIKVRSRAQAIRARGDAYFEAWTGTNLLASTPPRPAQDDLARIRDNLDRIKLASQQAGDAFRPFFSNLRKLRGQLETDPAFIGTNTARQMVRDTREQGFQVLQNLCVLGDELQTLRPVLATLKPPANL